MRQNHLRVIATIAECEAEVFTGLASPTILPLAGRDDLVAAHFVVRASEFWERLGVLRSLGATGIVSLHPDALAP